MTKKRLAILVGIIALLGIGYVIINGNKLLPPAENKSTLANQNDDLFEKIIAKASSINLLDVSESGATGTAWLAVYEGKTYHRVIAKNMPTLPGTDFYEGWLVKDPVPSGFVSSGKMSYDPTTQEARLDYVIDGDMSDHNLIVITSEPDDNNPAPSKHIIEARFPDSTNLVLPSDTISKAGSYEDYSQTKIALAASGDVVLFFHAPWCPTCRALNSDIEKNLGSIPATVTILKTDYDTETSLKQKYGVTTQHTLVQVNQDGALIKKWSGSSKLTNLLAEL
ncbi:MAG: thioredoxin [Candidatus Berkelbacteria bacterium Gr01-1014_85]|uniref:Thioredoxin n=1 Tax=Candidatus Berkelbacteria bacterium Gr01-1014_85 TaxID=2017150 RepID=A0A554JDR3_9BACT|nr:MAG: thioredoxin [Candidatus Berkelbacteria bacterium Gr01-1014_85]